MTTGITHVGFSDESNWNMGQFRSLGLVTIPLEALDGLTDRLRQLLVESGVNEFKWKDLGGAKESFAAQKMCNFAIEQALQNRLRVDVLIWDIRDSRHDIKGRDDIANLQRMYYHLFRNVMRDRWPNNAVWRLYPDEHTAMKWDTVEDYLQNATHSPEVEYSIFTQGKFCIRLRQDFALEEIVPVVSHQQPLLQLADLFAGMAVFPREQFDAYQNWLVAESGQLQLSEISHEPADHFSKRSIARFQVLRHFDQACKKCRLGVSLRTTRGLWTPNPKNPLNFWMYEPQHPEDKAPTSR